MSTTVQRTPKSGRQSLFFRDLASPISTHRGSKLATPGQAAAVSALWRENFGGSDLPPPPVFTLDDRVDFLPESGLADLPVSPVSPEHKFESRTPVPAWGSPSPRKNKGEASSSSGFTGGMQLQVLPQQSPGSSSWWSPSRSGSGEKGKGSPVDGVVQPGALIMLPPPREVARPEVQRNSLPARSLDEEEWVTVYGFSPGDTNLVLRELEKCGVILKHIPGPRDANWMHILYQSRYDAQKALAKNGIQINSVLIIGVKLVDPMQLQFLNETLNNKSQGGFMVSFPTQPRTPASVSPLGASPRPHYLQTSATTTATSDSGRRPTGAIASPAKSVFSKVIDLMFGI